jgi:nitroreductase
LTDALVLLSRRRSVGPAFLTGPGPDASELETLLKLASRVPDHGKLAPWRFIVFQGEGAERAGRLALELKLEDTPAWTRRDGRRSFRASRARRW